jgi:hypothetical protein
MIKYQKSKDLIDQATFRFLITSEPIGEHTTNLLLKDDKAESMLLLI